LFVFISKTAILILFSIYALVKKLIFSQLEGRNYVCQNWKQISEGFDYYCAFSDTEDNQKEKYCNILAFNFQVEYDSISDFWIS
jgi:hypothetical protein